MGWAQPGDNYRAGASVLQDALTQTPGGQTMEQVADADSLSGGPSQPSMFVPVTCSVWSPKSRRGRIPPASL